MNLIVNERLGEQHFENTISSLINGKKCATSTKEGHLEIRTERLVSAFRAIRNQEREVENEMNECVDFISAAVDAHNEELDKSEESHGFISLYTAFSALESICLEHKLLARSTGRANKETEVAAKLLGGPGNDGFRERRFNNNNRGWHNPGRAG